MNRPLALLALLAATSLLLAPAASASEAPFTSLLGGAAVGAPPDAKGVLVVPFITWGGDVATFHANGGLETAPGSIYGKLGLKLKLVPGDDFVGQVKQYLGGGSAFLRGTFGMVGLASEAIGSDPRTKGVVALQLTWSAGDHMIARPGIRTVTDLKGKTIALQKGGPHVSMLDDVLKTAGIGWDDVKIAWCDDLSGAKGAAERFRKDESVHACFAISPDMAGLTGGLQATGTGAEGTVKGARVLVSTAELSRSIADVYVVRKDFYDANRPLVEKFVAGYLKAVEELVEMKKQYETKGSESYLKLLGTAQKIYGKEVLPTLDADAHGLVCDASFVGYPGNVSFFRDPANLHGFEGLNKAALDLATGRGYAKIRVALIPHDLDFGSAAFTALLTNVKLDRGERFKAEAVQKEIEELSSGGAIDDRTIYSFTINFEANQNDFTAEQYGAEFQKVVELADKYGSAVVAIRGHSDPTKTLLELVKAGMKKGVLKRSGSSGNYRYSIKGRPLDLSSTAQVVELIRTGEFDGDPEHNPREVLQSALNLSKKRADAVRDAVIRYAADKNVRLDKSQIQPVGVGIAEPFIAKPANLDEARQNMRVEFRLIRVSAEAAAPSDFDF